MFGTFHYNAERKERETFIQDFLGEGQPIDTFIIDQGHKNGRQIYTVTSTGVVIVSNEESCKIITKLIARPEQLKKMYATRGEKPPRWLLRLAYKNNQRHYNEK